MKRKLTQSLRKKGFVFALIFVLASSYLLANDTIQKPVIFYCKDFKITGTLILPKSNTKVPVIVWIEGSGPNSPLDTARREWYEKNFTEILLKKNIGILYYNKRGVGGSEGKWYTLDFFDRAEETNAAVDFLKNQPEIDASKIGIMGHSQGGWIAQLVAALYPEKVKFAISLCGPSYNVRTQVVNDFQSEFFCAGMDSLKANRKAIKKMKRVFFATSVFSAFDQNLKQLKRIENYDPLPYLLKIKIPTLLVFCEYDVLVYAKWCTVALDNIFNNKIPENITVKIVPQASHGFVVKPYLCAAIDQKKYVYSQHFHDFYIDWISKQLSN